MKQNAEHEPELRTYLLGGLMPEDALSVEARLFLEDDYSKFLKAAEDDLVDDYVNGELTSEDREKFERHFLSDPTRRDDVKVARALKRYISAETAAQAVEEESGQAFKTSATPKRTFFHFAPARAQLLRLAAAVALLVVTAGGAWYIITNLSRPAPELARTQEQPTPAPEHPPPTITNDAGARDEKLVNEEDRRQEEKQFAREGGPPASPQVQGRGNSEIGRRQTRPPRPSPSRGELSSGAIAVTLLPVGISRDESGLKEVPIPPRDGALSLQLPLVGTQAYRLFEATLYDEKGVAVRSWADLKPTASDPVAFVAVGVPGSLLTPQRYQMKLRAATPDGGKRDISSYHFRAVNK